MSYTIKHSEVRLADIGTLTEPHLYAITAGGRNNKSLLFHVKIATIFHCLKICKINKKSVNMECVEADCCARHKFQVDAKYVTRIADGLQRDKGGETRDKFTLDLSNPELRDTTNWKVSAHNSTPHMKDERATFFTHIRKDFREVHTELGLDTLQSEVDTTMRAWNLRRYGPQLEAEIVQNKINEMRSAWYKINKKVGFGGSMEIPESCKEVAFPNWDCPELSVTYESHFQISTEHQHIFFLKSELYKFKTHDLFLDGTFHLLKNCGKYNQIYIISILYNENNATFSYPILFSFMKNRFTANYVELFQVVNHNFFEQFNEELSPKVF